MIFNVKHIFLLLLILFALPTMAQKLEMRVASFEQDQFDGAAKGEYRKLDGSGDPYAIVKVTSDKPGDDLSQLMFDFGSMNHEDVPGHDGADSERWLYVQKNAKTVTILRNGYTSIMREDLQTSLLSGAVYKLALSLEAPVTKFRVLQFAISPVGEVASIMVKASGEEEYTDWGVVRNDGTLDKLLPEGTYQYKINSNWYLPTEGMITLLPSNDTFKEAVTLRPNFGLLEITCGKDMEGATVKVDNEIIGNLPIKTGRRWKVGNDYNLEITNGELYKPFSTTFAIKNGETTTVDASLQANFKEITIMVDNDAELYIDGKNVGNGPWTGRLKNGLHKVEAKRQNHRPSEATLNVDEDTPTNYSMTPPKPITGSLYISSNPSEAEIFIDGKSFGRTPKFIEDVLIGEHIVTLKKEGYAVMTKHLFIREGEKEDILAALTYGRQVTITADQPNAEVYVDGKSFGYVGYVPYNGVLPFGSHEIYALANGRRSGMLNVNVTDGNGGMDVVLRFSKNQTITIPGTNVSFVMIFVEGGTFTMGATAEQGSDAYSYEKPAHQVTLSSYLIGETEVTQALWKAVMGSNPSFFVGDNLPVEKVSWNDCQVFIAKLNALTGKTFRLPTEAEWEYAARGGNDSKGYKYSGGNTINYVAWYSANSSTNTHPVKTKAPNELGVYDMSGNVEEWCQDWYGNYSSAAQTNPMGSLNGFFRVVRGGNWYGNAISCRSTCRNRNRPDIASNCIGLRLALSE